MYRTFMAWPPGANMQNDEKPNISTGGYCCETPEAAVVPHTDPGQLLCSVWAQSPGLQCSLYAKTDSQC